MSSVYEESSRGWSLCFRRGRSSWKSLKNLNTAGGGSLSILRIGLAPPLGGAVLEHVERGRVTKPRRIIDG